MVRLADPSGRGAAELTRTRLAVRGAVQGVGFRPFVFRLARELRLAGSVRNTPDGVIIEVEGPATAVDVFVARLRREHPTHALLLAVEAEPLALQGGSGFEILPSADGAAAVTWALPDLAPCPHCLAELFDPRDRRHRYPFLNCTRCGPRFSILRALPYDRARTTMAGFPMCSACRREFEDPRDRRFHAQPTACPRCGPRLTWWNAQGTPRAVEDAALERAVELLREGGILGLKGVGGFHLMVRACDDRLVARLRLRKRREAKPLAVMFPDLDRVRESCVVSSLEERLLVSPAAPIVLLARRTGGSPLSAQVAPDNPFLGAMLPSSPLHHLLLRALNEPLVATSGNRSEEPICIDEGEALRRLEGVADGFLVHDRPIVRPLDDSIVRVVLERPLVLRRARGYAPLPVLAEVPAGTVLAMGGHQKNTVALAHGGRVFVSQHHGDLDQVAAIESFEDSVRGLTRVYAQPPTHVAVDLHPDYTSTRQGQRWALPRLGVQHHHAHVVAAMLDNGLEGTVLGVAFDGSGLGTDGTIWGGEFLRASIEEHERVAALWRCRLPGGECAAREPRRMALSAAYEAFGPAVLDGQPDIGAAEWTSAAGRSVLRAMLERGLRSPWTSSAGRLFDAVSSLLGLCQVSRFEGEAAMAVEFAALAHRKAPVAPLPGELLNDPDGPLDWIIDWRPWIRALVAARPTTPVAELAARFHESLAGAVVAVAERVGLPRVVLSGGCFQNGLLTERTVRRLREAGFQPYWHRQFPPNDGGLSLGQAGVAVTALARRETAASTPREEV